MTFDASPFWEEITKKRRVRIQWEIEQGLDPVEAWEIDDTIERPAKTGSARYTGTRTGIGGAEQTYDREEIIRLYKEEGLSGRDVAERIGANPATVYNILRENNVTRPYRGGNNQHTKKMENA